MLRADCSETIFYREMLLILDSVVFGFPSEKYVFRTKNKGKTYAWSIFQCFFDVNLLIFCAKNS
jgi:hypothetical protein